jgi:O-antigen/teichoic acid export membrane protein
LHARTFLRDALGTALSQYVARLAVLVRGLVAAATMGPLGYGAWNALNLLLDYGYYAPCGTLQGLDLDLPPAAARGDRARARDLMQGAWTMVLLGTVLFTLAVAIYLATGFRSFEATWGGGAPALMLAIGFLQLAIQYHAGVLRAHGEFQRVSAALAAQGVLGGGLGLALVARYSVWGLLWAWLAGSLVALVWLRAGTLRPPLVPGRLRAGLALAWLGLPVFGFFLTSLVLRSVDRIAFVRYAGTEGLGLYSLGLMAVGLIQYLPESAATVLYPRMSAAAQGVRDPARTRDEVRRTQRALAVLLPPIVAVGMVWSAPVIGRLLPRFGDGVPALHWLAIGGLLLSAATLPGYFVLASGPRPALLAMTAGMALLTASLVFGVAARDHRPEAIAQAAAVGYGGFALGLVALAARGLFATARERVGFAVASFVPALWAGFLAIAACARGGGASAPAALLATGAILAGYLPALWWFGRGVGLRRLAMEWLGARPAPAR